MKFNILLNSAEDALVLVDKVSKYDCDVDVYKRQCLKRRIIIVREPDI